MGNSSSSGKEEKKGGANEKEYLEEIHKTDVDFEEKNGKMYVKGEKGSGFIAFYAPWCHFCTELAPAWNKYAKSMEGTSFHFLAVNCTDPKTVNVVQKLEINGYPTIKFIDPKTKQVVPAQYENGDSIQRTPEGFNKFLKEKKLL
jgi:thiol-disulfide isomerase/thioredoxin